jgi:alcohol dehydrogenase class IV
VELFDPKTRPCAVIWDEEALLTAPTQLCLSAAASCFSSVVGGLQTLGINPLAEGDLLQALRLLTANMRLLRTQPEDGGVRLNLTAAAYLANRSSDNGAGGGGAMAVVSSLAHSLDARYPNCDHGSAYSVLTAPGIRFNRSYNTAGQARLAFLMGVDTRGMEQQLSAQAAADAVESMYREAGMPLRLKDVGVPQEGIQQIAEDSMTDFGLHRNVRPVERAQELVELLEEIW